LALKVLTGLLFLAANALLFELARRSNKTPKMAFCRGCGLGFAHLLLAYRLEYPWDGIDVLLFLVFGYIAAQRTISGWLVALLCIIGVVNHETALYIPLWYLLRGFERTWPRGERLAAQRVALLAFPSVLLLIWGIGAALYVGKPVWATDTSQDVAPVIGNQFHLVHNLRQLFVRNWSSEQAVISVAIIAAIGLLIKMVREPHLRPAAIWTLCVLASVACFGYVNETRLYLVPVAFWFGLAASGPRAKMLLPVAE
jgi:hypothetical protein